MDELVFFFLVNGVGGGDRDKFIILVCLGFKYFRDVGFLMWKLESF